MKVFFAPHNDDEALFGSFTILREKPLVVIVTDGIIHEKRGIVTAAGRREESKRAMKVLGAKVEFMGLPDDGLNFVNLAKAMQAYIKADRVFAPQPYANGNGDHNLVGQVARKVFGDRVTYYDTYRKDDLKPQGNVIVFPTQEEVAKKCEALFCYESQIKCNQIHFEAVVGHPEYYVV